MEILVQSSFSNANWCATICRRQVVIFLQHMQCIVGGRFKATCQTYNHIPRAAGSTLQQSQQCRLREACSSLVEQSTQTLQDKLTALREIHRVGPFALDPGGGTVGQVIRTIQEQTKQTTQKHTRRWATSCTKAVTTLGLQHVKNTICLCMIS